MHRPITLILSLSLSIALSANDSRSRVIAPRVAKPPVVDGQVNPVEWKGATHVALTEGQGEALLLHDGNYLYVGIIGFRPGIGSLCVKGKSGIRVLHASAALGTAAFEPEEGKWRLTRPFTWTNRDTGKSAEAMADRQTMLTTSAWFANASPTAITMREYQVPARNQTEVPIVISFFTYTKEQQRLGYWPANIEDDCVDVELAGGFTDRDYTFDPSKWGVVVLKQETSAPPVR